MLTASVVLMSNASATSNYVKWPGGRGSFCIVGTFGGATATLQRKGPDPAGTAIDVGTDTTKTANGIGNFDLPPCELRVAITGGPPSGLYAVAERVPA